MSNTEPDLESLVDIGDSVSESSILMGILLATQEAEQARAHDSIKRFSEMQDVTIQEIKDASITEAATVPLANKLWTLGRARATARDDFTDREFPVGDTRTLLMRQVPAAGVLRCELVTEPATSTGSRNSVYVILMPLGTYKTTRESMQATWREAGRACSAKPIEEGGTSASESHQRLYVRKLRDLSKDFISAITPEDEQKPK